MALSWVRWTGGSAAEAEAEPGQLDGFGALEPQWLRATDTDWAQLLEQASDLNDELCRENCELHRELALLRQRRAEALASIVHQKQQEQRAEQLSLDAEKPPQEDQAEAPASSGTDGGGEATSSEETAALVLERVRLKELSMLQQERLLELELAREKLSGNSQGHWASRFTSALQVPRVTSRDLDQPQPAAASSMATLASVATPAPAEMPVKAVVGEEYEVVGRNGAILRESEDLESPQVVNLPPGTRVCVLELGVGDADGGSSRRARVCVSRPPTQEDAEADKAAEDMPPMGWLSVTTKQGRALIRPVAHFEDGGATSAEQDLAQPPEAAPAAESAAASSAPAEPQPGEAQVTDTSISPVQRSPTASRAPPCSPETSPTDNALLEAATALWEGTAPDATQNSDASAFKMTRSSSNSPGSVARRIDSNPEPIPIDGNTPIVVSTDAWLALRNERTLRERQIRALERQVQAAQRDLEQVAHMRSQLRDQRRATLDFRQEGSRLEETVRLTAEEVAGVSENLMALRARVEGRRPAQQQHDPEDDGRKELVELQEIPTSAEVLVQPPGMEENGDMQQLQQQQAGDDAAADGATSPPDSTGGGSQGLGYLPSASFSSDRMQAKGIARSVEWRRLLAERETTAWQLSQQLKQVEELETLVEEKRVELQAAERRRERERRSLLTALKELGARGSASGQPAAQGGTDSEALGTGSMPQPPPPPPPPPPSVPPPPPNGGSGDARERAFLQKISELEELLTAMQEKLDFLQARAGELNKNANVRAAALNYATAANRSRHWAAELLIPEELPATRKRSPDLEGLAVMLEGLFVENFRLLQAQKAKPQQPMSPRARRLAGSRPSSPTADVDLTPFIDDGNEDDPDNGFLSDDAARSSRPLRPLQQQPSPTPQASASQGAHAQTQPQPFLALAKPAASSPQSPRSLRRRMGGLDFNALSVAE